MRIVVNREAVEYAIDQSGTRLYENYSFDENLAELTFGVVGSLNQFMSFVTHLTTQDPDLAFQLGGHARHDPLGYDVIFYFPGFDLVELDGDREELNPDSDHEGGPGGPFQEY